MVKRILEVLMNNNDKGDRALQLLQTIMLTVMLGVGGWNITTTLETQKALTRLEAQLVAKTDELNRMANVQIDMLHEINSIHIIDANLDKRLSLIENRH